MKVKPKLYLNGSPQTAEEGSLAFARNMKIDNDGNLVSDYGYENIESLQDYNIVGHIVGLDNKIYLFTDKEEQIKTGTKFITTLGNNLRYSYSIAIIAESDNIYYFSSKIKIGDNVQIPTEDKYKLSVINPALGTNYDDCYSFKLVCASNTDYAAIEEFHNAFLDKIEEIVSKFTTIKSKNRSVVVKGPDIHYALISHNMEVEEPLLSISPITQIRIENDNRNICNYSVIDNKTEEVDVYKTINTILEYDEIDKTVNELTTGWHYSNGEISGYVSTNITGEKILTIAEYKKDDTIPLKHINLAHCSKNDDESLYCQAPICPTANLILKDTYVKTIPNGVYIFFIRYKIRKNVYTNWFLCSRPIYGGCSENITTFQGGLKYINLHKDSAKSFIFDLLFAQEENKQAYKEFQLGFIINHDEATDARTWKHFDINTKTIYFDYENVEETNIDDLLKVTYELYNVRNVTAFKNKLYISNYKETNFNYAVNLDNIIDLQVVDNYDSSNSNVPKATLSGYELSYNNNDGVKYFDKTITNISISTILDKNNFDYTIYNLNKTFEIAKDAKIASFILEWDSNVNPDIAFITKVENKLYNNCIFGKEFEYIYPSNNASNDLLAKFGIKYIGTDSTVYYYEPIDSTSIIPSSLNNSLYNLGFSFAFGSRQNDNKNNRDEYLKSQAFNEYTFYNIKSHGTYVRTYNKFYATDLGFTDKNVESIKNVIKEEIESRSFFAKAYIIITSGAKSYKIGYESFMDSNTYAGTSMDFNITTIVDFTNNTIKCAEDYKENAYKYYEDENLTLLNPNYFNTNELNNDLKNNIIQWVFSTIQPIAKGISVDNEGNRHLILDLSKYEGNTRTIADNIQIVFRKIDFKVEVQEDKFESNKKFKYTFNISMDSNDYISNCTFNFNSSLITTAVTKSYSQLPSLMPFSKYRTYVHFVDNHNIITNGIKLKDIETKGISDNSSILSLTYKLNKDYNNYYKSFFISIKNIGDVIIEGFGYKKLNNTHILNFLELDTLLYNINDNITIINNTGTTITTTATYYSSGSSSPSLAFGNCGYVSWDDANNDYTNEKLYIKIVRDINNTSEYNLIKASEYIPLIKTNDYINLIDAYYGSWFCSVTKPDFDLSSSCYVSGRDIYTADRTTNYVGLKDFTDFKNVNPSITYYIRSNFNLNYLSLTEDITDSIFSINGASSGNKQVIKVINSAILSYIYELKSMYKDFMNKTFSAYDEYYKIQFDNTIRVSNVLSDETFNNSVFKFDATDYYNIPTDRGIIVSLFAIGNTIYAHTKGSLYKFDATQTIMSTNEDIKLQESEPFDIGLSQVFDSQYGYGGIENKEAGCITFDSYFFYDNKSNHIFAYAGNNQIQLIDGTIYKFLTYFKPKNCRTIHDAANNRIIFEFYTFDVHYKINFAISYNYKSKSFVSFHDITLEKTFSTRTHSYCYLNGINILFSGTFNIGDRLISYFVTNSIYGNASKVCEISADISNMTFPYIQYKQNTPFVLAVITFPKQYFREVINSISYLGYELKDISEYCNERIFDGVNNSMTFYWYRLINAKLENKNPIDNLYIETDTCISTPINNTIDDSIRPNDLLNYKGFKYDKGLWTTNYFRNAINKDNIYNYPDQPRNDQIPNSDNYSLVYGRFFILNFNLTKDFPVKFEEVFINSEKY